MFHIDLKEIEVLPYVRMTTRGKFLKKRAIKYLENQNHLAWLFNFLTKKNNFLLFGIYFYFFLLRLSRRFLRNFTNLLSIKFTI